MTNKRSHFIALGIYFLFVTKLSVMRRLKLVLMSNVCYLAIILIFLVVTARYLVVTVRYWWLLLVSTFSMNEKEESLQ